MSRKSKISQNWQFARRISTVTGRPIQRSRTLARDAASKRGFVAERFMRDDKYLKHVLENTSTDQRFKISSLETLAEIVEELGGIEDTKRVLDVYERIMNS